MATGNTDRLADYVPVSERISKFYEEYNDGRILTAIVEHSREDGFILMRAEVYRSPDDAQPAATGHAYEVQANGFVNKTSYIENCETGAVGRALAIMGYEIKRGIASREEMEKVERMSGNGKSKPTTPKPADAPDNNGKATQAQVRAIGNMTKHMPNVELLALMKECGCEKQSELTFEQAVTVIQRLQQEV